MSADNFDQLFNPIVDMGGSTKGASDDYQVSADKGKNGIYQSVIRFVPWWSNPNNSIQEKWVSWLVDPVTQKGRFVDCPSSVGKPSLLQDMFWKLKKSESIQEQKKAEIFSRRHNFSTLVQIIKDEQQPELEGKIMVYRFGKKLWEKINAELKPIIGEPHNPFDLLNGKAFALVVTKVSGFNNYDQSKFIDKVIPLCLINEAGKLDPINAKTDKALVFNYLKEKSPDLTKFGYKDWDSETYDYVNGVITAVTGQAPKSNNMSDINNAIRSTGQMSQATKGSGITSSEISLTDLDMPSGALEMPTIDLPEMPSIGGIGGNIDDILKDL